MYVQYRPIQIHCMHFSYIFTFNHGSIPAYYLDKLIVMAKSNNRTDLLNIEKKGEHDSMLITMFIIVF